MQIEALLTEETILEELGGRPAQRRLELQLTQADLAYNDIENASLRQHIDQLGVPIP